MEAATTKNTSVPCSLRLIADGIGGLAQGAHHVLACARQLAHSRTRKYTACAIADAVVEDRGGAKQRECACGHHQALEKPLDAEAGHGRRFEWQFACLA